MKESYVCQAHNRSHKSEGYGYHSEVTMLTTAVVPLRLRSIGVLLSSESAKSNALFSACTAGQPTLSQEHDRSRILRADGCWRRSRHSMAGSIMMPCARMMCSSNFHSLEMCASVKNFAVRAVVALWGIWMDGIQHS